MKNDRKFGAVLKRAHEAGLLAGNAATPVPMLVGTPTTLFGNDLDYSQKTYIVEGGECGFAMVRIKGNTAFGRWAAANPNSGFRKSDSGGLRRSCHEFGQSLTRKEAYVAAFVRSLDQDGISAYSESRLD
jgi:hypothetical protein